MEKDILVCIIVGTTVMFVTIWVSVDFCFYRKRKREAREKQKWMFYNYGRRRRLAFPHSKEATGAPKLKLTKKEKRKRPWKRLMTLFHQRKILKEVQSKSSKQDMKSELTSSGISDCISEHYNSNSINIGGSKSFTEHNKCDKISTEICKKRNSITPSDILTPNRMALSPVEMASVFNTDTRDDILLYSPDFDAQSVSSSVSSSRPSSISESIHSYNEKDTARLTK